MRHPSHPSRRIAQSATADCAVLLRMRGTSSPLSWRGTDCDGARRIGAPCGPRSDIKRGLKPNCAHGCDRMGRRIATTTIDSDFHRPICSKRRKAGVQIIVRFEFSISNVIARRGMNGSRNMPGTFFVRIADIGRPRPRIQQSGLPCERRGLLGVDRWHTPRGQNDIADACGPSGDMV